MTSYESFMSHIVQDPEDDTVRLVFADFLEEQADAAGKTTPCPRSEFIRRGIELANTPVRVKQSKLYSATAWAALERGWKQTHAADFVLTDPPTNTGVMTFTDVNPEYARLESFCEYLFNEYGRQWFPDLLANADTAVTLRPGPAPPHPGRELEEGEDGRMRVANADFTFQVRRGFAEVLHCPVEKFLILAQERELFRHHPIREVYYTNASPANASHRRGRHQPVYAWWVRGAHDNNPGVERTIDPYLPSVLMPHPDRRRNNYPTREEANAAASKRAVQYARDLAFGPEVPA